MSRYSKPYRDCIKLQKTLEINAVDGKAEARDVVSCVKAWIELEYLKREMRGIPRLLAQSMKEIAEFKKNAMKSITRTALFTELSHEELPEA